MARTKNTNEERKTLVKGMIADAQLKTFEAFEVETAYTRSLEKAVKFASAILNPDNEPHIMVSVSEIVNEKAQRKLWNNTALYLEARKMCMSEEEANDIREDDEIVVKGFLYTFYTNVWAYNIDTHEYITEFYSWSSGYNSTAKDARAVLAMRYEKMHPNTRVIGMHTFETSKGYTKAQDNVWYVINKEFAYEHCMKQEENED